MNKKVKMYKHHNDELVAVFADKKGQHRDHCLCFQCKEFQGGGKCEIANAVYENCKKFNIVSPVWECPKYVQDFKSNSGRPLIICLVGESSSGKSRATTFIGEQYGIKLIQSYTDRAMRDEEIEMEKNGIAPGHTFISKDEFDQIDPLDMIAYTDFGAYRYCCTKQDVADTNIYVIDEFGLKLLRKNFAGVYDIVAIRFQCDEDIRLERAGEGGKERLERDKGKFTMNLNEFNFIINTNFSIENSKNQVVYAINRILDNHTDIDLDLINFDVEY